MKQIVAVPLDYMACGELRIANPARFMQMMGMDITLLPATKFRGVYQDNIIFTQRLITNEVIGLIKKLKDQLNCKVHQNGHRGAAWQRDLLLSHYDACPRAR